MEKVLRESVGVEGGWYQVLAPLGAQGNVETLVFLFWFLRN